MKVKEAMTKNVIFVGPEVLLKDVLSLLSEHHISGVPVVDDGEVVGVFTESDLMKQLKKGMKQLQMVVSSMPLITVNFVESEDKKELEDIVAKLVERPVEDVMIRDVVTVDSSADLVDAIKLMSGHQVNRLPVVEKGKMVGIITRENIIDKGILNNFLK